jgi:hypothetical protein
LVQSSGICADDLSLACLEPVIDIGALVRVAREKDPALPIAVLPHGPYCVPFLA